MKSRFFLDVVVGQCSSIFQLFPSENKSLLVRRDAFRKVDLALYFINDIARFNVNRNSFSNKSLNVNLHASLKGKQKLKGGVFLDLVFTESLVVFKLFPHEEDSLFTYRDAFLLEDCLFKGCDSH